MHLRNDANDVIIKAILNFDQFRLTFLVAMFLNVATLV